MSVVAAMLAAIAIIGLMLSARNGRTPAPARSRTTSPSTTTTKPDSRPYPVQTGSATFTDTSRQARVGGTDVPRSLVVDLWYPGGVSAGRFPLVVFAPGYLQCPEQYGPLLQAWAAAGFVVAGIRFPATNCSSARGDEADIVNQPADVATVISGLTAGSGSAPGIAEIDRTRIAVAGHSDGGDVAAVVVGATCCRDQRVSAGLVMAGAELSSFGGAYFSGPTPPLLVVQGTADTVNPASAAQALYAGDTSGQRWFLSLIGAGHLPPYQGSSSYEQVVARVTVDFLRLALDNDSAAGARMASDGNVPGVAAVSSG
ncbi:MAG TPA: hypothetical protein VFA11_11475 [Acidimicrobiales bacterium]|nr:hypothetical protein [Acidimicrobiales bacterium]